MLRSTTMSSVATSALSLNGVSKRLGSAQVLDGLNLALAPGEVFALLGPNGAGKTTTINIILGFLRPDTGTVRVGSHDVAADPIVARGAIAYIPEQVALYPALSGVENLRYFVTLAGLDLPRDAAASLLQSVGVPEAAWDRAASHYSKGMRQKVGIAIAKARSVDLLLLDEPTSGLDPAASAEFARMVRTTSSAGTAVLMATHDLYRIRETADRVGVMHHGRLIADISADTLAEGELERRYVELLETAT